MGLLNNWFGKRGVEVHEKDNWEIKSLGNIIVPQKFTTENAFILANSIPELYFPCDFYADRISKLRPYIATPAGREIATTELNRFIDNRINPLFSFSDLLYAYVFSLMSDGNAHNYLTVPSLYKGEVSPSTIERWDVLQPNLVTVEEQSNLSILNISNMNELVKRVYYNDSGISRGELIRENYYIQNLSSKRRANSRILTDGLLHKSQQAIDILLSVYSARYNVYANNGAAGYLARKGSNNESLDAALMGMGNKREDIVKDIIERDGLTGKRNIWGISSVPLEFVKTLATISELMPLEETLELSIKIAAPFQIPSGLIPRKDQSTFDNQAENEQSIWENGLLSMADTVAANLTKMFRFKNAKIMFDYSDVSALATNETANEALITAKLSNIEKLKAMNPELDIALAVQNIYKTKYGEYTNEQ
jgi:hypothetical protein